MAAEKTKKRIRKVSYAYVQRLFAGVSLLAFVVMVISGMMAHVGVVTIAFRALVVMLVISLVARVVVKTLAAYEEMNSGQA